MSEPPVDPDEPEIPTPILGTATDSGVMDPATATEFIVNVAELATVSGPKRAAMVMITYDAPERASVVSGGFTLMQSMTRLVPWTERPQTALLLTAENLVEPEIKLRFSVKPPAPVAWRAAGMTFDGRYATYPAMSWETGDAYFPTTGLGEIGAGFLAAGGLVVPISADAPASQIEAEPGLFEVVDILDGHESIRGYWWKSDDEVLTKPGGPFFKVTAEIKWRPKGLTEIPPCCDCADVFLINDPFLALNWDVDGSSALIDPATLLLNHVDSMGTRWIMTQLTGWWNLPPPTLPTLQRAGVLDGAFPVDGRYESRVITLEGKFWPGPHVTVARAREKVILAADAVRGGALLVVKEPLYAKQAYVYLADQPEINTVDQSGETEFSLTLRAVDPVKYHAGMVGLKLQDIPINVVLGGRVYEPVEERRFTPLPVRQYEDPEPGPVMDVENFGNTKISPIIYMFGPVSNPTIRNITTNQKMTYLGTIGDGSVLVTDTYWRTVTMMSTADVEPVLERPYVPGGENRRYMLTLRSPWIDIVPGVNTFRATSGNEGGRIAVKYRSGWIGS